MGQQGINLFVVENKNGRNEQFLPLFSAMNNAGYGKLVDKKYYIISSSMNVQQNSKETIAFTMIHQQAIMRGLNHVMYCL